MAIASTTPREAGTLPPASRAVRWRPSLSHILIALAAILAFALNFVALQDKSSTTLVAVADTPIAAGTVFSQDDIRLVPVSTEFAGLDSLLTETEALAAEGWIVDRPIDGGAIIESSAVVEPGAPSGLRSMSIPVSPEHAAGGAIRSGDRVDIISVSDGQASYVVSDVGVIGIADEGGDAFGVAGDYFIVVGVDAEQALALAEAMASGSVELLRSTGAPVVGSDIGS